MTVSSFMPRRETESATTTISCQETPEPDGGRISINVERFPVAKVPIALISGGVTLRRSGPNLQHVRALAESDEPLPPILVQRTTMRVIDGVHRVLAARMRGQDQIDARLFDGD
ncbi:MAG TPA: hypothetical protein VIV12_29045, partial [Streptosporangiaceae bacterium]